MRILLFVLTLFFAAVNTFASAGGSLSESEDPVIKATLGTYTKLNTHWTYPHSVSSDTYALVSRSDYWFPVRVKVLILENGKPVEDTIFSLTLNRSKINLSKPTQKTTSGACILDFCQAYDDLLISKSALECTIAHDVVKAQCVRALLGDDLFNDFATLVYQKERTAGNVDRFFSQIGAYFWKLQEGPAKPGSTAYITNIQRYTQYKPFAHAQGHNLMCVGPDAYMGFDPLFASGPRSYGEIVDSLSDAFMSPEGLTQDPEGHARLVKLFDSNKEIFRAQQRKDQTGYDMHYALDLDQIASFTCTQRLP